MSYSFTVTADTKADAKQKIAQSFDAVVNGQSSHAADRDPVVACGSAFVEALAEPQAGDEIYVTIYGCLSWRQGIPEEFTSASASVNASLRNKPSSS